MMVLGESFEGFCFCKINTPNQPLCWKFSDPVSGYCWIPKVSGIRSPVAFSLPFYNDWMHLNGSDIAAGPSSASVADQTASTSSCCHSWKCHTADWLSANKRPCCLDKPWCHTHSPNTDYSHSGSFLFLAPFPSPISQSAPCLVSCACGCDSPGRERTSL